MCIPTNFAIITKLVIHVMGEINNAIIKRPYLAKSNHKKEIIEKNSRSPKDPWKNHIVPKSMPDLNIFHKKSQMLNGISFFLNKPCECVGNSS